MCGIAGIVTAHPNGSADEAVLLAMRDAQSHRGPDQAGLYLAGGIGLAHRRLSIIDLTHGRQPMVDEAAGLALVYNGELYNFRTLRAELEQRGFAFRSNSDTEVLLRAWQHWDTSCLSKLRGMFAFAIWDARKRCVHLVRDRLGIKPLYYALTRSGDLVFASELKGLLAHPGVARTLDPQALEEYLAFGYVPDPKSIYRGICKLPAAHHLSWHGGDALPTSRIYWDVPFAMNTHIDLSEATTVLRERLDDAVASHLVSDVPLGAFLSGGVDSSAVVASMSRVTREPVSTCAIGFDHSGFDETVYARRVADHLHTRHFEERVSAQDYALVDTLADIYDEPFADSSALPTYRVCELARRHVTVALSGDGGDENFAGYRRYRGHWLESRVRAHVPRAFRASLFGVLGRYYPKADWAPKVLRAKTTFQALSRDTVSAYFHTVSFVPEALRQRLYSASFKQELGGYSALEVFQAHAQHAPTDHPLLLAQYLDFKTYLPGDILTKVDRASMAHSLEVRVPLLDHPLVEWASSLVPELKLRGRQGKYVLKQALAPDLPHEVLDRRKMGFSVPLAAWFRGPLAPRIREALGHGAVAQCGYFERPVLDELVHEHIAGRRDHGTVLWSLLMLDAFLRKTVPHPAQDRVPSVSPAERVAGSL